MTISYNIKSTYLIIYYLYWLFINLYIDYFINPFLRKRNTILLKYRILVDKSELPIADKILYDEILKWSARLSFKELNFYRYFAKFIISFISKCLSKNASHLVWRKERSKQRLLATETFVKVSCKAVCEVVRQVRMKSKHLPLRTLTSYNRGSFWYTISTVSSSTASLRSFMHDNVISKYIFQFWRK